MILKLELGPVFVAICVNDYCCAGTGRTLDKLEELMQIQTKNVEAFSITVTSNCLGCEVIFSDDEKKTWLGQPHVIKNLKCKFGDVVKNLQGQKTPGTLSKGLTKCIEPCLKLSDK